MSYLLLTLLWLAIFALVVLRYAGAEGFKGFYHLWKSVVLAKDCTHGTIDGGYAAGVILGLATVLVTVILAFAGIGVSYRLL